jgi:hypothetical protein
LEEVASSSDEVATKRLVRFPFCPVTWVCLRKLRGHEDVLDDRTQDIRIDMSGNRVHECVSIENESLDGASHGTSEG